MHEQGDSSEIVSEVGQLTNAIYQRYAKPMVYNHEDQRHVVAAWRWPQPDGTIERGMRVSTIDSAPAQVSSAPMPTVLDPKLVQLAADDPGAMQPIMVRLRDFPDWNIPLVPLPNLVSASEYAQAEGDRQVALAERQLLFSTEVAALTAEVVALGGSVSQERWETGWLVAQLGSSAALALASHPDVQTVMHAQQEGETHLNREDIRPATMGGAGVYNLAGHYGDEPNPGSSWGTLVAASIDVGPLKDEARAFCNDAACTTSKILHRYRCDAPSCVWTSAYNTTIENFHVGSTNHSTNLASAVVGDYLDGQAAFFGLGDTGTAWRQAASADAREARLIHFGPLGGFNGFTGTTTVSQNSAYTTANTLDPDVIVSATGFGPTCQISAMAAHEMAAENAFDDGALLVMSAGNLSGAQGSSCAISGPANLPKVMAINGLDMNSAGCSSDYSDCKLDLENSARGGAMANVGGTSYPSTISMIDAVVPQRVSHFTECALCPPPPASCAPACDPFGRVDISAGGDSGTSFAAPRFAGLGLLTKDYHLSAGHTWIDDPGWLHVFMLTQTDAHRSLVPSNQSVSTYRAPFGTDFYYGLGRIKMRHPSQFGVYGFDARSVPFTTTAPYNFAIGGVPLHSSTEMVKCVMVQHEDMSHKSDTSWVTLELSIRNTSRNGACCPTCTEIEYVPDTSRDTKHMVASRAGSSVLGGKCAYARVTPNTLPSSGSVWTQTVCYVADEVDDAPN